MPLIRHTVISVKRARIWYYLLPFLGLIATAIPGYAASPWENAVDVLERAFTGPILGACPSWQS